MSQSFGEIKVEVKPGLKEVCLVLPIVSIDIPDTEYRWYFTTMQAELLANALHDAARLAVPPIRRT